MNKTIAIGMFVGLCSLWANLAYATCEGVYRSAPVIPEQKLEKPRERGEDVSWAYMIMNLYPQGQYELKALNTVQDEGRYSLTGNQLHFRSDKAVSPEGKPEEAIITVEEGCSAFSIESIRLEKTGQALP